MNNTIAFDQFQRYKTTEISVNRVKEYCNKTALNIIEVGANRHKNLEKFLPNDIIKYLDIDLDEYMLNDPKYILGDATNLKNIKANMYDFVVALDVFEHITKSKRKDFLKELNRISKYGVLISAPFDYDYVMQSEHRVNVYFKAINNDDFIWLKEHIQEGLPNISETINILEKMNLHSFKFEHGDLELWEKLIKCSITSNNIYINELNSYYNNYIFNSDVGEKNYRTFILYSDDKKLVDFVNKDVYTNTKNQINYTKINDLINEFNTIQISKFITNPNKQQIHTKLYFDNGTGFNENNTNIIENDTLQSAVLISKIPQNTQNIRFDPTENSCCKLANLQIYLDNQLVHNFSHNGEKIDNIFIFKTNDPQILIENTEIFSEIKISYDMQIVDESIVDIYFNYSNLLQEQSALQNEIFQLNRTDFTSKIYIDIGSGFSEDNFVLIENINTNIEQELLLPNNTKGIRFDPFEGKECVVKNLEIYLDNMNFESYTHNGLDISGGILFNTINSQINIDNISGNKKLYISCKIVFIDRDFINIYNKNVSILNLDIQLLNQNIESLNLEITDKKQHIESLNNEVLNKNNHIDNLSNEVTEKNQYIENLESEILIKDKEIGLSKVDFQVSEIEINRINTVILEHENNLAELNAQLVATTQEYQLLAQQNHELNQELVNVIASYQEITNAFFWKITKPFRALVDLLKRIKIINLFIKGLKSIKNDGISNTLNKVNTKLKKN